MTKRLRRPMLLPMLIGVLILSISMGCAPKKTAEQSSANAEAEKALQAEKAELEAQLAELEASQNQKPKGGSNQEETVKGNDKESMFALSAAKKMEFNRVNTIPHPFDPQDDLQQLKYGYTMGYMDNIDVIGWSKKGLLAYRYISDGGGRGGLSHFFVIVDTVSDKIIINDHFNDEAEAAEEHERNAFRDKWNSLLEKYSIEGGKVTDPCAKIDKNNATEFPLGAYNCWFDYSARDGEYGSPVYSWRLIVGNNAVQKVITRQVTDEASLKRIKLLGYYKSPFENRIAILVSGGSGFSGNVYFEPTLYGCNMSVGLD